MYAAPKIPGLLFTALLIAGCATSGPETADDAPDGAPMAGARMGGGQSGGGMGPGMREGRRMGEGGGGMMAGMTFEAVDMPDEEQVERGREIYQNVCSACHSIDPPMKEAPPLSHVARHIRKETETRQAFTAHVVEFVTAPNEEASVMPAHAIERFGLMPGQPLGEAVLSDVAAYMWTLTVGEPTRGGGMGGGGMGGGGNGAGGHGGHGGGGGMGGGHGGGGR